METISSAIFGILILLIYFAPTWLASRRRHKQETAIFILNLFTGWTVIGWIAALVWASTN